MSVTTTGAVDGMPWSRGLTVSAERSKREMASLAKKPWWNRMSERSREGFLYGCVRFGGMGWQDRFATASRCARDANEQLIETQRSLLESRRMAVLAELDSLRDWLVTRVNGPRRAEQEGCAVAVDEILRRMSILQDGE